MIYIGIFLLITFIVGFSLGFVYGLKYSSKETIAFHKLATKHMELFKLAVNWIKNSDKITAYINEKNYKKIGIYGMSYLGDCLVETLKKAGIEVMYGIDKKAEKIYNSYIKTHHIDDKLPRVDAIIVTAIVDFEKIKSELECKLDNRTDIVSLENILHT